MKLDFDKFIVKPGSKVKLKDYDTGYAAGLKKKKDVKELQNNIEELAVLQEKFWADNRYSMLIILQAPDAAGKDGAIRHVMSGLNPQSCRVHSYKAPSREELDHDYLWRHYKDLPERGMIEIFNRSHYENVLATKVNPEYLMSENIPGIDSPEKADKKFWNERYEQINNFEKHIHQNGTRIVKIFLHLSKEEQKERLLARLNEKEKNWKFSSDDLKSRAKWDEFQAAYEEMMEKTSTEYAPWYVVPADKKFFARVAIGEIIVEHLKKLDLQYPAGETSGELQKAKEMLMNEV
ncbi:MAG: polyphosphate kinase 2 family protein [Bacteroidia bacterium]|nr:polyphosphate kinase 2 family protein [Bacteroidia bacterium]